MDLSGQGHRARDNEWYGQCDQEDIRQYIAYAIGEKVGVALSALPSRVGEDLPVVGEWPAFCKIADDDSNESCDEDTAHGHDAILIGFRPSEPREPIEELENSVF